MEISNKNRWESILNIVTVCKRMWQKGFVANHDGNASVKIDGGFLATPTAVSKADIIPEIILTLDADGKKVAGPGKPFSEMNLHLAAYHARPDIAAVVHAHPPYATVRGACGLPLNKIFMPEALVSIGDVVPVAPFIMPGSPETETQIAGMLERSNVFMLAGNGVLAVGADVMQAYLRIELVEHLAKMDFIARQTGNTLELSNTDTAKLLEKRAAAGLEPPMSSVGAALRGRPPCKQSEAGPSREGTEPLPYNKPTTSDDLRQIIGEELKKILRS